MAGKRTLESWHDPAVRKLSTELADAAEAAFREGRVNDAELLFQSVQNAAELLYQRAKKRPRDFGVG